MTISDHLPSHLTEDGRATESCSSMLGRISVHGVLIVCWLPGCLYVSATAIVVLAEAAQGRPQSTRLIHY